MATQLRYSRSLAPSDPKSVPDYLNREHQKLEMTLDSVIANGTALTGDKLSVIPNDPALGMGFANVGLDNNGNRYKGLFLSSSGPVARPGSGGGGAIVSLGVTNTGPTDTGYLYVQNDDGSIFAGFPDFDPTGGTSGVFSAFGTHPWRFEITPLCTASNYTMFHTGNLTFGTGLSYNTTTGVLIPTQQAAIANDASGAANQATVNAILAALRAGGILAP